MAGRKVHGVWVAAFVLSIVGLQPAPAGDDSDIAKGRQLFRIHCATCHGESARGDGPTAKSLKPAPPNLTRLAAANGGTFPSDAIFATIDGRDRVPSHRQNRMPIWGFAFQDLESDVNQEEQVRVGVETLVRYLESIQKSRGRKGSD